MNGIIDLVAAELVWLLMSCALVALTVLVCLVYYEVTLSDEISAIKAPVPRVLAVFGFACSVGLLYSAGVLLVFWGYL